MAAIFLCVPWDLLDSVGIDVALAAIAGLYENLRDSKYRPCLLFVKMFEAGWLDRKIGGGFYNYKLDLPCIR